jgi:hypothetical protein
LKNYLFGKQRGGLHILFFVARIEHVGIGIFDAHGPF